MIDDPYFYLLPYFHEGRFMKLIFIYGLPAAGKLTIAKELAAATAFKLFHNHASIGVVELIFELRNIVNSVPPKPSVRCAGSRD